MNLIRIRSTAQCPGWFLDYEINQIAHNHQSSKIEGSNTEKRVQIENSAGLLEPPSSRSYLPLQYVGRVLLCNESENPNIMAGSIPPHPTLGGLLLYVAILSKVKRSDLSLHRSILSLTLNPSGVWAEMIEQSVLSLPNSLTPSLPASLHRSLPHSVPQ